VRKCRLPLARTLNKKRKKAACVRVFKAFNLWRLIFPAGKEAAACDQPKCSWRDQSMKEHFPP
jgi:hypothetical protein